MVEKIPKKKMPEIEIGKEQIDELRTISAVTKMLADSPEVATEIAEIFHQVAMEKERELVERVTKLLEKRVEGASAEQLKIIFPFWVQLFLPPPVPARFQLRMPPAPHVWHNYVTKE